MLLLQVLAYRIQAAALGDLDPASARLLDRLASEGRSTTAAEVPVPDRIGLRPGTVLIREWDGTPQRVMVLADGCAWNGTTYQSLSQVARAITGTRDTLVRAIALGRRWLEEIVSGRTSDPADIAAREGCSTRHVMRTISVAFELGKAKLLRDGKDALIISSGFYAMA